MGSSVLKLFPPNPRLTPIRSNGRKPSFCAPTPTDHRAEVSVPARPSGVIVLLGVGNEAGGGFAPVVAAEGGEVAEGGGQRLRPPFRGSTRRSSRRCGRSLQAPASHRVRNLVSSGWRLQGIQQQAVENQNWINVKIIAGLADEYKDSSFMRTYPQIDEEMIFQGKKLMVF